MRAPLNSLAVPADWLGFAWYQATDNLKRQYNRTKLGPLWIVLTQFVMIFGIAFVYSSVFNQPINDFLPFISASILTWNIISPTIAGATTVYVAAASMIQSFRVPVAIFPMQSIINQVIIFMHGLVIHSMMLLFVGKSLALLPIALLMALLLAVILFPFIAVLGILSARFRDLGPAVGSFMYMAFLLSPVIWKRETLGVPRRWIVDYNPFAHMLEIVRQPMIGNWPPSFSLSVCVCMAIVSVVVGELVFRRLSRPLPFWV
ncbi:MAG: ABC transporter permease [Hyphomicrobiaceae bacterium]